MARDDTLVTEDEIPDQAGRAIHAGKKLLPKVLVNLGGAIAAGVVSTIAAEMVDGRTIEWRRALDRRVAGRDRAADYWSVGRSLLY